MNPHARTNRAADTLGARALALVLSLGIGAVAQAGQLSVGEVQAQGTRYTFPIVLEDEEDSRVAGLNCTLEYDPAVFRTESVDIGANAAAARKQLASNLETEGRAVIVILGVNQSTIRPGEIARVGLRRIGTPDEESTVLRISNTTFTSPEAEELPSEGGEWAVDIPRGGGGPGLPPIGPTNPPATQPDPDLGEPAPGGASPITAPYTGPLVNDDPAPSEETMARAERLREALEAADRARAALPGADDGEGNGASRGPRQSVGRGVGDPADAARSATPSAAGSTRATPAPGTPSESVSAIQGTAAVEATTSAAAPGSSPPVLADSSPAAVAPGWTWMRTAAVAGAAAAVLLVAMVIRRFVRG